MEWTMPIYSVEPTERNVRNARLLFGLMGAAWAVPLALILWGVVAGAAFGFHEAAGWGFVSTTLVAGGLLIGRRNRKDERTE
jgi:hypothetical protein